MLEKRILVETASIARAGLQSQQLTDCDPESKAPNYFLLEGKTHRIVAPSDNMPHSIIFWTKEGLDDTSPTSEKIVGYFCKNLFSQLMLCIS